MRIRPTQEQVEIIDAFEHDLDVVIEAGAGTGKSSTLALLGDAKPRDHGLYLAFNRAVAEEARGKFPPNVQTSTSHAIAFRAVGRLYDHRLGGQRVTARAAAEHLGIKKWFKTTPTTRKDISSWKIASMATDTVRRFCHSDDEEITAQHVPYIKGIHNSSELRQEVLPYAIKVWQDVQRQDGVLAFNHDHYFKIWALGDPKLTCDFLMVDEAQDVNPVLAGVVRRQRGMQKILVGDANQQLFQWRGAVDFLSSFDADERLFLSQSFRFGPEIADEANRWLSYLDAPLRLTGHGPPDSRLCEIKDPDAVLCRTNADVISQALLAQERGVKVGIVGGTNEIVEFAKAAEELKRDGKTSHRDLSIFNSWNDVMTYVKEENPDGSFGTFMRLIDSFGTNKVLAIADLCVADGEADRVVSTVHKVKGLEWDKVAVDGAIIPETAQDLSPADLQIAYVAATRAKHELDVSALEGFHRRQQALSDIKQKKSAAPQNVPVQ